MRNLTIIAVILWIISIFIKNLAYKDHPKYKPENAEPAVVVADDEPSYRPGQRFYGSDGSFTVLEDEAFSKRSLINNIELENRINPDLRGYIKAFSNLRILDIRQSNLQHLPSEIENLPHLEEITLHFTEVQALPASITQIEGLKKLDLNSNALKSLPDSMGKLKNLKFLNLGNNSFLYDNQLINAISQLDSLERLFLQNNEISRIPPTITQLKNLEYLDISGNRIENIAEDLKDFKNLEYLYLHDNPISNAELQKLKNYLPQTYIFF